MKILSKLAIVGAALALTATSFAAVGVVDLQKLVKSSPYSVSLQKSLKDQFSAKKAKLDVMRQKMVAGFENFNKNKAVMKKGELKAAEKKLMQDRSAYFAAMTAFQKDYMTAEKKVSEQFLTRVKKIVKADAQEQKLDMVLPTDAVFYATKEVNLTSAVLKQLK